MKSLQNKRILFFSPTFFGYNQKIKKKMEELGAIVDMFDERSVSKNWQKALLKINPNIFRNKTEKYYFDILQNIEHIQYDYVFFIKSEMPTSKVLSIYKKTFKDSKFCLYMYDSMRNIPNIEKKLVFFDYISSFDRQDCINHKELHFRPLFYCDDFKRTPKENEKYKYDLCFIGTIHSDRYKIIKKIIKNANENELRMYVYPFLQSKFVYYWYKLTKSEFKKSKINEFKFIPLSSLEISEIVDESKIIIDIQHPKQTGLTMRTIEMLGMNKKIITTNEDIKNYDFFDENNIKIINREDNYFDFTDLKSDYVNLDDSIYSYYSLSSWIFDVLGDDFVVK